MKEVLCEIKRNVNMIKAEERERKLEEERMCQDDKIKHEGGAIKRGIKAMQRREKLGKKECVRMII